MGLQAVAPAVRGITSGFRLAACIPRSVGPRPFHQRHVRVSCLEIWNGLGVSAHSAAGLSGYAPCRLCRHGHSASIPHAFAPAALRASLASRGKPCELSPPRDAWRPRCCRTGCAGSARPTSRRDGRDAGEHAGACCGRLCRCVPSSTLAVPAHHVTKDGSRTTRPVSLWSFHATPQDRRRKVWRGVLACRCGVDLARVSGRAGEAFGRGCRVGPISFRSGSAQGVLVSL